MIRVIDNFLDNPHEARAAALAGTWGEAQQGGATFPGIQLSPETDWKRLFLAAGVALDRSPGMAFYRLYVGGQKQPTFIHTDGELGAMSAILYLSDHEETGTAFWTPARDGADVFDESQWKLHTYVASRFNRLVVFPSQLWHSRYPRDVSTATAPEEGRLIQVFFF